MEKIRFCLVIISSVYLTAGTRVAARKFREVRKVGKVREVNYAELALFNIREIENIVEESK